MSEPDRRDGGERWPVLARLPDVSAELAVSPTRTGRARRDGGVEYRFDPPQSSRVSRAPQAHAFHDSSRRTSPVLPRSNPFEIPAATLQDRLAPVGRFLVMFALFTAAGTTLITLARRDQPEKQMPPHVHHSPVRPRTGLTLEPAGTAVQQSFEAAVTPSNRPKIAPTASGPTGIKPPSATPDAAIPPESTIGKLQPEAAAGTNLPKVRTADAAQPPAVARLPGYVLPPSTRQAQHDDNQSSIH